MSAQAPSILSAAEWIRVVWSLIDPLRGWQTLSIDEWRVAMNERFPLATEQQLGDAAEVLRRNDIVVLPGGDHIGMTLDGAHPNAIRAAAAGLAATISALREVANREQP